VGVTGLNEVDTPLYLFSSYGRVGYFAEEYLLASLTMNGIRLTWLIIKWELQVFYMGCYTLHFISKWLWLVMFYL